MDRRSETGCPNRAGARGGRATLRAQSSSGARGDPPPVPARRHAARLPRRSALQVPQPPRGRLPRYARSSSSSVDCDHAPNSPFQIRSASSATGTSYIARENTSPRETPLIEKPMWRRVFLAAAQRDHVARRLNRTAPALAPATAPAPSLFLPSKSGSEGRLKQETVARVLLRTERGDGPRGDLAEQFGLKAPWGGN